MRVTVRDFMEVILPLKVVVVVELVVVVQIRPDEPSNIPVLSAVEVSHAPPQSVCAKDDAPENMPSMVITLDTSHAEMSPLNDVAEWNMMRMLVTLDTSHLEMSQLNASAWKNISSMSVTLDTSHLETSPVNLFASGL